MRLPLSILFLLFSSSLFAGQDTYSCVVKDVRVISDNGLFEKTKSFIPAQVGWNFIIKKRTGEVVGEQITSERMIPDVLDKGGSGNNFKVLNRKEWDPTFREILYIEVMDSSFHSYPYSFLGLRFNGTFSGICK